MGRTVSLGILERRENKVLPEPMVRTALRVHKVLREALETQAPRERRATQALRVTPDRKVLKVLKILKDPKDRQVLPESLHQCPTKYPCAACPPRPGALKPSTALDQVITEAPRPIFAAVS